MWPFCVDRFVLTAYFYLLRKNLSKFLRAQPRVYFFEFILFYFMRHFFLLFLGFTPSPGPKGEQLICMPQRYTQQCLYVYVLIVGRRDSVLADLRERQNKARPKATALSFEVVNSWSGHNLRARTEYEMPRWEQAEQKKNVMYQYY